MTRFRSAYPWDVVRVRVGDEHSLDAEGLRLPQQTLDLVERMITLCKQKFTPTVEHPSVCVTMHVAASVLQVSITRIYQERRTISNN